MKRAKKRGKDPRKSNKSRTDSCRLAHWTREVLAQHDKAGSRLSAKPVHDLRVAIRRCRSIAEGLIEIDADPVEWKPLQKAPLRLFRRLGRLRDIQVMKRWVRTLSPAHDPVGELMLQLLAQREKQQKKKACKAISRFDRKQWKQGTRGLPKRSKVCLTDGAAVDHLVRRRFDEAYALHRQALRNRSKTGWHQLRIGVKRFRYSVENFLPEHSAEWKKDLQGLQDLLGEVHDLDVLWDALRETGSVFDKKERATWRKRIDRERQRRLKKYRERTIGRHSLWSLWRAGLPKEPS